MSKKIMTLWMLAIVTACSETSQPEKKTPTIAGLTIEEAMVTKKEGVHFKRVALVVSDIDRSLKIYRDALGFEPNTISSSPLASFGHHIFGAPDNAEMRFVSLNSKQEMRTLALSEVKGVELTPTRTPPSPYSAVHVIEVLDINESITNIKKLGLKTSEFYAADYDGYSVKEQGFSDYDGHQIVLYELIPHEK
ncbi:VOC family protein [Sphingorhabdus sp. EL138]|uniref:VOC family protein n=1 Tax=Sphingorhabdus sp. EL138 TaxID=2073156 RepID=UPI000D69F220|nr:VOC family protein [Sphingorhabdus sp. EL138]